jgi:DNA primase
VVALAQYGIEYAVAALGTATTPFHITKLMRQTDEIVFSFDGDHAGRTAAWRAAMNALPALTDGLKLRFLFLPKEHDPDSYVREFGKEKFEQEMHNAMPLSQYIIAHLSENNPLNSDEDQIKFLRDAAPILMEIKAPLSALYMRKKIAELAGISVEELQQKLKLPAPNKVPRLATQKQSRAPISIKKRFVLMLLMRPGLARNEHLNFAQGFGEENMLLQASIHTALQQPQSKPAALLHAIESKVDTKLLNEIKRELHLLDESLDFALEFEGACTQLLELTQYKQDGGTLDALKEKPLNTLTGEERDMLKNLTVKKTQNKP